MQRHDKSKSNPKTLKTKRFCRELHTVEEMLRKSVIWHVLCNEQSLIPITAITYQIRQPLVPQLPHSLCLFLQKFQKTPRTKPVKINHKTKNRRAEKTASGEKGKYSELLRIGPSLLGELLDGDPAPVVLVLEATLVDDVGGLLAALGHDEIGAEVVGGGPQVGQGELRDEPRRPDPAAPRAGPPGGVVRAVGGLGAVVVAGGGVAVAVLVVGAVVLVVGAGLLQERRPAATHDSRTREEAKQKKEG